MSKKSLSPKDLDPKQEKEFYEPYNGRVFAIPDEVRKVLEQLNGQRMSINEAMEKIWAVAENKLSVRDMVTVDPHEKCLHLHIYGDGYSAATIVPIIKFREPKRS
jgi:hypothetical protein